VFNTLLQVMDDGRLTDGQGRDGRLQEHGPDHDLQHSGSPRDCQTPRYGAQLLQQFKPEFINRLDDIVRFHALSREQLAEIVDIQVARVIERLADRGRAADADRGREAAAREPGL